MTSAHPRFLTPPSETHVLYRSTFPLEISPRLAEKLSNVPTVKPEHIVNMP